MKARYYTLALIFFLFAACKNEPSSGGTDLMKYGMPIKIDAPADAEFNLTDYGFAKDLTITKGTEYNIQILSSKVTDTDLKSIKTQKMNEVKGSLYFSRIVEEFDNGFIFEKKISENILKYDFRSIKLQADEEYIFQAGLTGNFTEEQIKKMYKSVQ